MREHGKGLTQRCRIRREQPAVFRDLFNADYAAPESERVVRVHEESATVLKQHLLHEVGRPDDRVQHGDSEVDVAEAKCSRQLFGHTAHHGDMNGVLAVRELSACRRKHTPEKARATRHSDCHVTDESAE